MRVENEMISPGQGMQLQIVLYYKFTWKFSVHYGMGFFVADAFPGIE